MPQQVGIPQNDDEIALQRFYLWRTTGAVPAGTFNGIAPKGALAINTVDGTLYQNTGTKAATVWTAR